MKSQDNYPTWKGYLFRLQQEAPKPKPVYSPQEIANRPYFYGGEYHGLITREDGERLCLEEGNFLIRGSQTERGRFTLVLRVLGGVKNFKLYFDDGKHYVGEKRFDSVYALAEDGLITMYVEHHAQNYIPNMAREPVYNSLSRYSSIGNRRSAEGRHRQRRKGSHSPQSDNLIDAGDAVVPNIYPNNTGHYDPKDSSPVHFHNPIFEQKIQQAHHSSDLDYGLGYVPPDVHAPEYLTTQYGHMEIMDPYSCYHDDAKEQSGRRVEIGSKKNLTPTSSDERKRTKKRVATEGHVLRNNDQQDLRQDKLYLDLANSIESSQANLAKPRRPSYEQYGRQVSPDPPARRLNSANQRPTPAPRQNTMAHVKQLSSGALVTLQDCSYSIQGEALSDSSSTFGFQVPTTTDEMSPYKGAYNKLTNASSNEGTSLEQLMAVHKHLEENPDDFDHDAPVTSSVVSHVRQSSEPVEWMYHHSRGSSMDGSEPRENPVYRDGHGSRDPLFQVKHKQQRKQTYIDRSGSLGSCESEMSNVSSVSSANTGPSHDTASSCTHESMSRLSSEDDRNTPSPRHMSGLLRRASESPIRACSSYNAGESQHRVYPNLAILHDESPWKPRREMKEEQKHSRSRSPSAARKRAPLSLLNANNNDNQNGDEVVPKPRMEKQREPNKERRKSGETAPTLAEVKETEIGSLSPAVRHKSESAMRDHDHVRADETNLRVSRTPPTARRSVTAFNSASDVTKPKVLQRRATTGDVMKQRNGAVPSRSKSNAKERSPVNEPSSPVKSIKMPGTPALRPRNVTSPSTRHRNLTSPSKSSRGKCAVAQQYDKEHHYKSHTYRGLQWCEYCGNFMWGIILQGVQCIDCGLNVHKQCAKLVPNDCQPALKHVKHVYGVDLTTLVKLHGTQRPVVVDMCIAEIEKRGMTSEGIYRVPGSLDDVIELKAAFDQNGADADISCCEDVNTIAGALKLYLRELPVPLIPYQLYSRFINAAKISHSDGKLRAITMALLAMPRAHFETVKYIIQHLGRITEFSSDNQMSAHNLGIVFGPTILRTPEKDMQAQYNLNDTHCQQGVIETMIEFREDLFATE
uniref:Beta-chimaerin n=1 Tax=Phallusia mammillata TaxID=59560 RepID=A0A6F9DHN2_9ASCI|nr:uncharacterized protein LOC100186049 [Phallusia mammillata]